MSSWRAIVADSAWNRSGDALVATMVVATMIVFAGGQPKRRIVRLDLAIGRAGIAPTRQAAPAGGAPEPTAQERQCRCGGPSGPWRRALPCLRSTPPIG